MHGTRRRQRRGGSKTSGETSNETSIRTPGKPFASHAD
jgi:hypothetical protein